MNTVVIGVGTNLGDRLQNMNTAVRALNLLPRTQVTRASRVYETAPVGVAEQPMFLNAVLEVETEMSPLSMLGACLGIEASMGRVRKEKDGPRIIDLDLILFGGVRSDTFELTLPHPRALERAFVLVPMMDLYPSGRAPGFYFLPALREIGTDGITRTDLSITLE
ncbi:MAG: 2-amino-4-hydroxy-6-hydroxymethyldihydropteridine diphosphokinase [Clostridia bacterium]